MCQTTQRAAKRKQVCSAQFPLLYISFIEKYEITPRENDVVEAMLQGKTDKEIAVKLNMAVNTVQVHLKRIYRKTGAAGCFALSALVRGG